MTKKVNCSCKGCAGCVKTTSPMMFVPRYDCTDIATHRIKDWGIGSGLLCDKCAPVFAKATNFEVIKLI